MSKMSKFKELKKEKKSLKSLAHRFAGLDDSPAKIALSFSLGLFIAFSPILGTHLIIVFIIILIFRVNKIAILTGALVNNPWTIVPMYTAGTFLGFIILGSPFKNLPEFSISDFLSLGAFFGKFKTILYPYLIGCTVLGIIAAFFAYFIVKKVFTRKRAAASHGKEGQE